MLGIDHGRNLHTTNGGRGGKYLIPKTHSTVRPSKLWDPALRSVNAEDNVGGHEREHVGEQNLPVRKQKNQDPAPQRLSKSATNKENRTQRLLSNKIAYSAESSP